MTDLQLAVEIAEMRGELTGVATAQSDMKSTLTDIGATLTALNARGGPIDKLDKKVRFHQDRIDSHSEELEILSGENAEKEGRIKTLEVHRAGCPVQKTKSGNHTGVPLITIGGNEVSFRKAAAVLVLVLSFVLILGAAAGRGGAEWALDQIFGRFPGQASSAGADASDP
jgi:hypothetical protein